MREKRILEELMNADQYCSLEYFSKQLQVSTRTISNDIKYLMQDGERNGFCIHLKRRSGYYLEITSPEQFKQYMQSDEDSMAISSKERVDTIIALLLLQSDYITQETIADTLAVSKSIIKVDMAKVEKALFEHSISLIKKAHYGITLSCEGMMRKLYLLELQEKDNLYVKKIMDHYLSQQHIQHLEKQLINLLKQYRLNTNYIELKKIDLFLKVTVLLAEKGIESSAGFMESSLHKQMAAELAAVIQDIYEVKLSAGDICDIGNYLKQKTKPSDVSLYDERLIADMEAFLQDADEQYHTQFNADAEFKKSLLAHVSLLLDRLHQSISFSNPLVHEISVKYPVIFNICIRFAGMLEAKYHVKTTQDEIGFIATHFAAHMEKELHHKLNLYHRIAIICSSGGGSAFLIKLKLETIFSSSNIETFSLLELDEVRSYDADIIFTIKALDEPFDVPIVLIKELLDDADIQKIKNMLETDASLTLQERTFSSLFRKNAFHIFQKGSYEEMVSIMAAQLEQEGYCEAGYAASVRQREEVLSTVYNNGIAIPHPLEMCGRGNILSVGIVKQETQAHDLPVQVIFLVDLEKGDLKLHQNITRVLFDVMSDPALIQELRRADSYEDFMKCISHLKF